MFQGVHSTVIGDSHIRKGIVCQDSSGTVVTDKFAIAVVADGHGSAKHFRSDVGSRIAVKITTKLLKNYMNRPDFKEQFFKHPEFILAQMEKDGTDFVWEDLRTIPEDELNRHFPNIVEHCREMGYDVTKECIPVVPAQHYFMGGIQVNHESKTSMEQLYAVGETACNGVHGKNRLASNSLLESLVFAKRAALDMAGHVQEVKKNSRLIEETDMEPYRELSGLYETYQKLVKNGIQEAGRA